MFKWIRKIGQVQYIISGTLKNIYKNISCLTMLRSNAKTKIEKNREIMRVQLRERAKILLTREIICWGGGGVFRMPGIRNGIAIATACNTPMRRVPRIPASSLNSVPGAVRPSTGPRPATSSFLSTRQFPRYQSSDQGVTVTWLRDSMNIYLTAATATSEPTIVVIVSFQRGLM